MATATVVSVNGSRMKGYGTVNVFGDGCLGTHIEVECDNGVTVTVYPDGTVGRKDWSGRNGIPRI